jgi:protease-4
MKFLGNVLAVIVGLFAFSIVALLIVFALLGMLAASSEEEVTLEKNSILHLDLNGRTLVERTSEEDLVFGSFLDPLGGDNSAGLANLKKAIAEAKTNENIKGIYLNAGLFGAGQAGVLGRPYKTLKNQANLSLPTMKPIPKGAIFWPLWQMKFT